MEIGWLWLETNNLVFEGCKFFSGWPTLFPSQSRRNGIRIEQLFDFDTADMQQASQVALEDAS